MAPVIPGHDYNSPAKGGCPVYVDGLGLSQLNKLVIEVPLLTQELCHLRACMYIFKVVYYISFYNEEPESMTPGCRNIYQPSRVCV